MIRVRFAPTPTGHLFLSGARVALANDLFARRGGGQVLLRVDDLDQDRSRPLPIDQIMQDLRWFGIEWHESFRQSERMDLYLAAIERLKRDQFIYPCFESEEELKAKQEFRRKRKPVAGLRPGHAVADREAATRRRGRRQESALALQAVRPDPGLERPGPGGPAGDVVRGIRSDPGARRRLPHADPGQRGGRYRVRHHPHHPRRGQCRQHGPRRSSCSRFWAVRTGRCGSPTCPPSPIRDPAGARRPAWRCGACAATGSSHARLPPASPASRTNR